MSTLKFDKDGFLVGKGGKGALEVIIDNTEKILARVGQGRAARSTSAIATSRGKVTIAPIPKVGKTITQIRKTPTAAQTSSQVTQKISVAPTIVQTANQAKATALPQRDASGRFIKQGGSIDSSSVVATPDAKEAKANTKERKKQTKLLDSLVKKSSKNGMGSFMLFSVLIPLLSMIGALVKLPITLPLAMIKGTGKMLLPGLFGGKGGSGVAGKWGKRFLKGGILGGAMALLGASDVEASGLSRSDKNKAHVKNGASGLGGVGGAMAGAMLGASIGSVVPIIGTTIGGVLGAVIGGFSGSLITESVVDWLDGLIDPNLSDEMFSSWEGFTKGAGVLWGKFTKEAQKQSRNLWLKFGGPIAPYWEFLKIVAGDAWKVFSDAVSPYWDGVSTAAKAAWGSFSAAAKPYWDGVATASNKAWDTITAFAKEAFDKLKDTWVGEKAGQTGSAVSKGISTIAKGVGDVYTKSKEAITGYSDKTMEQAKANVSGDFPQYKNDGKGGGGALANAIAQNESRGDYNIYNRGTVRKNGKDHFLGSVKGADLSKMSINEFLERSKLPASDKNRMFATGKYQVIPSTMRSAMKQMGLTGEEKLTPELQERINTEYLVKQKAGGKGELYKYATSQSNDANAAVLSAAKEWASVGVPQAMRGANGQMLKKGQSYYAGDGVNKAHTSPETILAALNKDREEIAKLVKQGMAVDDAYSKVMMGRNKPSVSSVDLKAAQIQNKLENSKLTTLTKVSKIPAQPSVATPKIVQPTIPKISNPVVPASTPNHVDTRKPLGYRSNNLSQTSTSLPHKPLNRRVDHEYIAWMASGGTGMG